MRAAFWPMGGQRKKDPYDIGKIFFEINEPATTALWEDNLKKGVYRLRLGGPGGGNWSYIGTNRGGGGAGLDAEIELLGNWRVRITIGSKGADSKLEFQNPNNLAEWFTIATCGKGGDADGSWGGGSGGILSINTASTMNLWGYKWVWSNGIGGVGSGSSDTASVFTGQNYSRGNHSGTGFLQYLRRKL